MTHLNFLKRLVPAFLVASVIIPCSVALASSAPVITLVGNATISLPLGALYIDPGARLDLPNQNVDIKASLDGGRSMAIGQITVDASYDATHTIAFWATSTAGLVAKASRTLVIGNPKPPVSTSTIATTSVLANVAGVAGALGTSSPAITTKATSTVQATSTPKVTKTKIACVMTAVDAREQSLDTGIATLTAAQNSAYIARRSALKTAYGLGSDTDIKTAVKSAWDIYVSAAKSAQSAWKVTRKAAWATFKTAAKVCKAPASVSDSANAVSETTGQ